MPTRWYSMGLNDLVEKIKDFGEGSLLAIAIVGTVGRISLWKPQNRLSALIFHVDHRFSDIRGKIFEIYNNLSANRYNTLLLPQEEFDKEKRMDILSEFRPCPIMLNVFTSADEIGNPYMLNVTEIGEIMSLNDVRALRFAEVISWHKEHNRAFPSDYATQILSFCKEHGIFLQWNEWDIYSFDTLRKTIKGYENYVIPSYEIIGQFEPQGGFSLISGNYWGAGISTWYWEVRGKGKPEDMPIDLVIQFSKQARDMGAIIIQYEPYQYFFNYEDNTPKPTIKALLEAI